MHGHNGTISAVWPDISAVKNFVGSGAGSIALPLLPFTAAAKRPALRRVVLSCSDNIAFAFTLSTATVALADLGEGITWYRGQGHMIVEVIGWLTINFFVSGACDIHVTPLTD